MDKRVRILLIGKNSFVGKNYIKYSKHREIQEVDSFSLIPEKFDFSLYDVIIHLAAIVHQSKEVSLIEYLRVNTELPIRIATKAKHDGVKQFVFLSTTKVYGDNPPPLGYWDELSECIPTDGYGESKLRAERGLLELADNNFVVSIIRTPLVYGVGVKANMLNLIKLVKRLPVLPFGRIKALRSLTFVGNLAAYIDRVIELRSNGIFIAQDPEPVTVETLVKSIAKALNRKALIFHPGRLFTSILRLILPHYHARLYGSSVVSNSRTLSVLNFTPPFTTDEGIKIMVKHFLTQNGTR